VRAVDVEHHPERTKRKLPHQVSKQVAFSPVSKRLVNMKDDL